MHQSTLIVGATGFIGKVLIQQLEPTVPIICWVRDRDAARITLGTKITLITALEEITEPIDVVINLAGAPIMDHPWSAKRKIELTSSRVEVTKQLLQWTQSLSKKPTLWLQASAIGYYPFLAETLQDEDSPHGEGFLSNLCVEWENTALQAEAFGVRVAIVRTGLVLGKGGGALSKLSPLFRSYLGGTIGSGEQWVSWIHLSDHIRALQLIIRDPSMSGPYNLCSPKPLRANEFYPTLAQSLDRPNWFKTPAFALKILLGDRASLLTRSQKISPAKLCKTGFIFSYPQLKGALCDIFSTTHNHEL